MALHGECVLTRCMSERRLELFTHCGLESEMWRRTAAVLLTASGCPVLSLVLSNVYCRVKDTRRIDIYGFVYISKVTNNYL